MVVRSSQGKYIEAGLPPERSGAGSAGPGRRSGGQQAASVSGGGAGPPPAPPPHCTCRRHKHVSGLWQLLEADQPAVQRKEKNRKTTPFGVSLMRSQELYWAAQELLCILAGW